MPIVLLKLLEIVSARILLYTSYMTNNKIILQEFYSTILQMIFENA